MIETTNPVTDFANETVIGRRCEDFDEECADMGADGRGFDCHLACWLYDPSKGICPFLTESPSHD